MLNVPPRHLSLSAGNAFFIRSPPALPEHLFGINRLCMDHLALVGRSLGWTLFRIAQACLCEYHSGSREILHAFVSPLVENRYAIIEAY